MKLKELPNEDKPRERLVRYGASNISNEDLISILLRTGNKDENVKDISNKVLSKIDSIENLDDLSINELIEIKGIGKIKAITLLAAIELGKRVGTKSIKERLLINNTMLVHKYFAPIISNSKQEELLVILLDNKKRLISHEIMYKGTSEASNISVKEIYNYAIKNRAAALIIMHNHPSGVINPSTADKEITNNLISAGKIMGIPLLDHIITNGEKYYSFFDEMIKNEV